MIVAFAGVLSSFFHLLNFHMYLSEILFPLSASVPVDRMIFKKEETRQTVSIQLELELE